MNLSDNPIKPGTLKKVEKKDDGKMGMVFFLLNDQKEQLAVKLQGKKYQDPDPPSQAIVGTAILKRAGVRAPELREASKEERKIIVDAVLASEADVGTKKSFSDANNDCGYMVLMKFAKGRTIKELAASPQGAEKFVEFIQDEEFQVELGRILGADVFSGNADRMHVFVPPEKFFGSGEGKNKVFANTGNLIIKKKPGGSVRPIAIDNRFGFRDRETHLPSRRALIEKNFGLWGLGCGAVPSLALAVGQLAHQEAGLLFEHFLSLARDAGVQEGKIDQVGRESKKKFQENVANGANQALNSLLRGHNWKAMLRRYGCEKEEINAFRQHKRLLRQLMATTEPEMVTTTMIETAIDYTNFKQWAQTHEYKLEDKAFVESVLQEPLNYKLA